MRAITFTEYGKRMIHAERNKDSSYVQIGKLLNVNRGTIAKYCKKNGIAVELSDKWMKAAKERGKLFMNPDLICKQCKKPFRKHEGEQSQDFCGRQCQIAYKREHEEIRYCDECNKEIKGKIWYRYYCSKECYEQHKIGATIGVCIDCGKIFERETRREKRCDECQREKELKRGRYNHHKNKLKYDKINRELRKCKECNRMFSPEYGSKRKYFCCNECCYKYHQYIQRHIQKAKRRARKKYLPYESINPFDIFNRDKWRCQICGIKTPKSKRGTFEDNAPELDHIISLAEGGHHVYFNLQCLCRKCNQAKGASTVGQLGLAI